MHHILIIEDEPAMAETLAEYLSPPNIIEEYEIKIVHTAMDALDFIRHTPPDAMLLDLNLPDMHGFKLLKKIQDEPDLENLVKSCAIIVLTGQASMNTAIEAMRLGAQDFLAKPVEATRLNITLNNALERVKLKEVINVYKDLSRDHFQGFIGLSSKMQAIYKILENAAQSKASVFITGESGTGKDLAARAIHNLSDRAAKPFEVLNCAAIPHTLLESEIFGHVKGAFTGAISARKGAASRANGGTIFLDEIGEMSVRLQAKLLRFIQSGTFTPVGGEQEQSVDVRFICATNRNPIEAVKQGLLREDLYYRLNVIPINIPPLRERGDDVLLLAEHFLKQAAQEEKKNFNSFSSEVKSLFLNYSWRGNVRELENTIRRIVVLNDGETIGLEELNRLNDAAENDLRKDEEHERRLSYKDAYLPKSEQDIRPLSKYEQDIILIALRICDGNITKAAKALGINAATIHRKKKQWAEEGEEKTED